MEQTKLKKPANVMDRIFKALQGFCIAGVIVSLIFIPLIAILGEKMIASAGTFSLGLIRLQLNGTAADYIDHANFKLSMIVMLLANAAGCAASWYCLRVLREILGSMKSGTPFEAGIAGKIRKRGWSVLIGGGVFEIGRVIGDIFDAKAYKLSELLTNPMINKVEFEFNISLWFVIAALILFFLSYIFRYGETLQQQSDETL